MKDQFTLITRRAFDQLLGERINDRLKGAMTQEVASSKVWPETVVEPEEGNGIVTTPEEVEGFHIVRSILRSTVSAKRVVMRDAQSYCAILLDDNNRKPICRLRFNNAEKLSLGIFNAQKEEERIPLADLDALYDYAEQIKAAVSAYLPVAEQ